jgi:AraC-like DNA-binding protein
MGIVAQGSKSVSFGAQTVHYCPDQYLLISVDMPLVTTPLEASPGRPYLGMSLELDPVLIWEVMVASKIRDGAKGSVSPGLRERYDQTVRMEALASDLGVSLSGLHHQFKAVTAMSPLQYQKQLRLQEARRRLLGQQGDAASVAFAVGYNSPSQFSREYKRLFGEPPSRDVERLRGSLV